MIMSMMRGMRSGAALGLAALVGVAWHLAPAAAQLGASPAGVALPKVDRSRSTDWLSHNVDLANRRYSPLDEINGSNVSTLTLKWSFETGGDSINEVTPLVADGVMYFNSGSKLFAVDATTGKSLWTFDTDAPTKPFTNGSRGPTFGNGHIYTYGPATMYAVDAKTGQPLRSFGEHGTLRIVNSALATKYPGKYPPDVDTEKDLGYVMRTPPAFYNNTLFVGVGVGDSHIPGGLLVAADATTGKIKWAFNTIPQGPQDEGWDVAKDTW